MGDLYFDIMFRSSSSSSTSVSFSSSSVSSSSSSSLSSSSSISTSAGWSDYTDDTYWTGLPASSGQEWVPSAGGWISENLGIEDLLALEEIGAGGGGSWVDSFRPTSMRVTWTQQASGKFGIVVWGAGVATIAGSGSVYDEYESGDILSLDFSGGEDIYELDVFNNNGESFVVTKIEFYG